MKKILIVLFGVLAFQGSVWADAKCDAGDPYTQECHAQGLSPCWDMNTHPSYPAQSNPWVVGEAVLQNDKMKDCRQVCAINDTCWQEKWVVAGNQPLTGDLTPDEKASATACWDQAIATSVLGGIAWVVGSNTWHDQDEIRDIADTHLGGAGISYLWLTRGACETTP